MFLVKGNGSGLRGRFAPYPLKEIVSGGGLKQKLAVETASDGINASRNPQDYRLKKS